MNYGQAELGPNIPCFSRQFAGGQFSLADTEGLPVLVYTTVLTPLKLSDFTF